MSSRRKTRAKKSAWLRRWLLAGCGRLVASAVTRCHEAMVLMARRLRRRAVTVIVDGRRRQASKLRRQLLGAIRVYGRALGTQLPAGLTVVVQRVVYDGRQLNGLLQAFETSEGDKRYLICLALSVNGRQVSDEELLAAVRHQLQRVIEDQTGKPVLNVPLDLEVPRLRAASIVEMRPEGRAGNDARERSPIPIQRIQDDQAS